MILVRLTKGQTKNEKSKHEGRLISVSTNVSFTDVDIRRLPEAAQASLVKINQPDPVVKAFLYLATRKAPIDLKSDTNIPYSISFS